VPGSRRPYRRGIEEARFLIARDGAGRLHDPDLYREYFQRLFRDANLDEPGIQALREALDYRQVAQAYRLIDEDTVPVVVPYGDAERYLTAWRKVTKVAGPEQMQVVILREEGSANSSPSNE